MKLLIVEDNIDLNNMLNLFFTDKGFTIIPAFNKDQGLNLFYDRSPDVIILDLNLPDGSGLEICQEIKKISQIPVLILTANSSPEEEIYGLKSGADDYVSKPFNLEILYLRLKTLIRKLDKEEVKISKSIRVLTKEFKVFINDQLINFSPKEYDLLLYLWENKGVFLSREKIINHVWGFDYYGDPRTVDTHINRLRNKIIGSNILIENKRGRGYRFIDEN